MLIGNTNSEVFRVLLRYIYAGDASEAMRLLAIGWDCISRNAHETRTKIGKELLDAADRYGNGGLKTIVETALVKRYVINMDTVVYWLLFADAKNCLLLNEQAMKYCISMIKDVFNLEDSELIKES